MTLAWIESEIEKTMQEGNSARAVYDLAALVTVRDYLQRQGQAADSAKHREAVALTAYSADLRKVPTINQVEDALGAVALNTPEERRRAVDMRTWAEIIRGKG